MLFVPQVGFVIVFPRTLKGSASSEVIRSLEVFDTSSDEGLIDNLSRAGYDLYTNILYTKCIKTNGKEEF